MIRIVRTIVVLGLVLQFSAAARADTGPGSNGSPISVGPIDPVTAAAVARGHLARLGVAETCCLSEMRVISAESSSTRLCYLFSLNPEGYVVVCADTALPPVIAYSLTGPAPTDLPPGTPLADLLRWDLEQRFTYADLLPEAVADDIRAAWAAALAPAVDPDLRLEQWPPAGTTPTGGWLEENWRQSAPYNALCPMDLVANARSVAGCPALAMAQILDYHGRLNGTRFDDGDDYYHNYGGNRFWIDNDYLPRDFPSFPALNNHLDDLFDSYFSGKPPSNTHIAALIFACGVACTQVYSASVSGTFGVAQAFDAYQRFSCDTAELLTTVNPELYQRLAQNMKDARPAHLAVVDPAWSYGHNLVVDGYNTNDYYHLNFGWGGSYNGWYLVPSGLPMSLTVLEGVIVDIMITPCAPGDCNCDGLVNSQDLVYMENCLTGPAAQFGPPGCAAFDADIDTDVDLHDFSAFQLAFNN